MMMSEIRKVVGEELKQSLALSQYAFQYALTESEITESINRKKESDILGIFDGDQLASKLEIIPLSVFIQEQEIAMGGIAGVATWPEYRRKKHVSQLIKKSLETMKENNQIISFLAPFKISFYRKFGWDLISSFAQLELEQQHLTMLPVTNGSIKRVTKDEAFEELNGIYETFALRYNGMLKRTDQWWKDRVYSKDFHFVKYNDERNQASGYLLYKMKERVLEVKEMIFLTEEARRGLWNFICQHDSMADTVKIRMTENDPLAYLLDSPTFKKEVKPYFMGRIVDALPFLRSYPFNSENSLFVHLVDEFAPWNNGTFHIQNGDVTHYQKENEGSTCAHPPKRGIQLDIATLSAILIGGQKPTFLYQAGKISGNEEDVQVFEKMIPDKPSFFYDFF